MKVTVLGCGAAFPRPGGACSGYLVEGGGVRLWVDAGNGTFSRCTATIPIDAIDAVVLTHRHSDHIADMVPLMYGRGGHKLTGLDVYAPVDVRGELLNGRSELKAEWFDGIFAFHDLAGGFELGGLNVGVFPTVHPVTTFGVRITEGRSTVVYTADTGWFGELPDRCGDADLLIAEATFVRPVEFPPGGHMWADEAGRLAKEADANRLILTHIVPTIDTREAEEEARTTFDGPLEAAVEGAVYEV